MLTALIAAIAMHAQDVPKYETWCPLMANRPTTGRFAAEYAGFRIFLCCDVCLGRIEKQGKQVVEKAQKDKTLIGDFMFDPQTHLKIDKKKAKSSTTTGAFVLYSANTTPTTDAINTALAKMPANECFTCPIDNTEFKWAAKAGACIDYDNVRYYLCGQDCLTKFKANPKLTEGVKSKVQPVTAKPYPIFGIDDQELSQSCPHCD